ncbi:hypothetical protein BJV78DRAFT_488831 [Lactifluus subvellereus]|nr:hypothetical protein BJV78DRAFT_488831 [Lactifluus subvellereus]
MLREHVAKELPLGVEAKKIIDAGGLVSDDIMVGMTLTSSRTTRRAGTALYTTDSSTVPQTGELDAMVTSRQEALDLVVELVIPGQFLTSRITGCLIRPASGCTYHREFRYIQP